MDDDQDLLKSSNGDVFTSDGLYTGEFQAVEDEYGQWNNICFNGIGIQTYRSGKKYIGTFKNSQYFGNGVLFLPNGEQYIGYFEDGEMIGKITCIFPDGKTYFGEMKNGKFHGHGTLYEEYINEHNDLTEQYRIIYHGEFQDGLLTGKGEIFFPDGECNKGEFIGGKLNGQGINKKGNEFIYVGEFKDGIYYGQGILATNSKLRIGEFKFGELLNGTIQFSTGEKFRIYNGLEFPIVGMKLSEGQQYKWDVKENGEIVEDVIFY